MIPILQSWLSDNLELANNYLDKYEYKAEGLALSNIYFQHSALIQYYHNKKELSKNTFEKYLQVFDIEKLRTLYFYYELFNVKNEKNKYISKFLNEYPNHSFASYIKKTNKLALKKTITPKEGVSETLYNLAQTLYSQSMFETSLALAQNSLYLNPNNHLVKYLISLNLNSLNKKSLH